MRFSPSPTLGLSHTVPAPLFISSRPLVLVLALSVIITSKFLVFFSSTHFEYSVFKKHVESSDRSPTNGKQKSEDIGSPLEQGCSLIFFIVIKTHERDTTRFPH